MLLRAIEISECGENVSDLSGRILQRVTTSEAHLEMDLRELNAIVYNITVKGDSGARAFKLIKE